MSEKKKPKAPSPDPVSAMLGNLTEYNPYDKKEVVIYSSAEGLLYFTVAVASGAGDAGGDVMTSSTPHRIMPGLQGVNASYWERVESDVKRQASRSGESITGNVIKEHIRVIDDLEAMSERDVLDMMKKSANIEFVGSLRSSAKHGENATRVFDAFWNHNASDDIKKLRYLWASVTGSKKVA